MNIRKVYQKYITDYANDPTNLALYEAAQDFWIHNANHIAYRDTDEKTNGYQFTLHSENEVCHLIHDIHTLGSTDPAALAKLISSIVWI